MSARKPGATCTRCSAVPVFLREAGGRTPASLFPPILAQHRRSPFAALCLNGLLQAASALAIAWLVRELMSAEHGATTPPQLVTISALAAIAAVIVWLRRQERIAAERLGQSYALDLREKLLDKLTTLDHRERQSAGLGVVTMRFVSDLTAMRQWVSLGVARVAVSILTIGTTLPLFAIMSPTLSLVAGAFLGAAAGALLILGPGLRAAAARVRRARSKLANEIADRAHAMTAVQVCGQVPREKRRLMKRAVRLAELGVERAGYIGTARAVSEFGTLGATLGVICMVAWGSRSAGDGTAQVASALALVGILNSSFAQLGRVYEYWQSAAVARGTLSSFLSRPSSLGGAGQPATPKVGEPALELVSPCPELEYENVRVTGAVDNVSLRIKPRGVTALVGPSGAGKSALLFAAAGMVRPNEGRIRLRGVDIGTRLDPSRPNHLWREVSFVGSETPLLRGSAARNLRYRYPKAPDAQLQRVLRLCELEQLITSMPGGLETRIQTDGRNLSLGERQRIQLARALLDGPRLLLVDELDANLDPHSLSALWRVIDSFDGTVVIVTHREETVARLADDVVLLDKGQIKEAGSARELLDRDSATRRFFNSHRLAAVRVASCQA